MTANIANADRFVHYTPNNSTGPFPVPFPVFDPTGADLEVTLNGQVVTSGWSFTGTLEPGFYGVPNTWVNGSISFDAPISGSLYIEGNRAPRRPAEAQFAEGRGVPARDHNTEYNILTATDRELYQKLRRTIMVPVGDDGITLPPKADRANRYLGFHNDGSLALLAPVEVDFVDYATREELEASHVSDSRRAVRTAGYHKAGDGGASLYVRVDEEPAHGLKAHDATGKIFARPITPFTIFEAGAKGDGVSDDTAAFQIAADAPHPWCIVPDGNYLVDTVIVTRKKRWDLGPSALVKMRSPHAGIRAVFDFRPGAAGSSIRGGIIDGNRDELGPYFANPDWLWTGLRALNVHDFTVEDVTAQNCVALAFWLQGNRMFGRNLRARDCGKGSQIKMVTNGHFSGLDFSGIGNAGLDVYQHVNTWRHLENVVFDGIIVKDFQPDTAGREPSPGAITLEECQRLSISNVVIDGFLGTSKDGSSRGFVANSVNSMAISGIIVRGYTDGVRLHACESVSITNFHLDGAYAAPLRSGILVQNAGIIEDPKGNLAFEARTPHASRHVSISNGVVKRFYLGMEVRGAHVTITNTDIFANTSHGVQINRAPSNGIFGGEPKEVAGSVELGPGVSIFNNGGLGVHLSEWVDFRAIGARIVNNGQDTSLANVMRAGIATLTDTGKKGLAFIENCFLGDDQNFIHLDAASFMPGPTDGNNRKGVYFNNLTGIYEGQWVRLVGAAGGGTDIVAKVIAINMDEMAVTVQTAAPATFSDSGNLATLTGTFDTSGQYLLGTGSQLLSEALPFAVIKANGEYRILRAVNADDQAILEQPFSADLSGATVQIIKIDVAGIPSQQYGERWTNLPPGSIVSRANRYTGVVQTPTNLSTRLVYGPESEVYLSTGASGVAMNTIGSITSLIQGLPEGWIPVAWRTEITEAITGTDATLYYEFRDSAGIRKSLTSNTAYAVGSKTHGEVHSDPFMGVGAISIRLAGGTSNVPTGGRIRAEIVCRVPKLPSF